MNKHELTHFCLAFLAQNYLAKMAHFYLTVTTVKETTYNMTSQQFKKYIIPTLGKSNIKNITITECQQLVNECSKVFKS